MAESDLTHEELLSILEYDKETGIFVWKVSNSNRAKKGKLAGGKRKDGYFRIQVNKNRYLSHRLAWFYCYKQWPTLFLDHIDGNPSNNSILNLREATHQQNLCNCSLAKNSTTKIKGVSYHKQHQKYRACISKMESNCI